MGSNRRARDERGSCGGSQGGNPAVAAQQIRSLCQPQAYRRQSGAGGVGASQGSVLKGVDFVIIRELTSGIYLGEPRGIETLADGQRRGFNTEQYTTNQIRRVARAAFELARTRKGRVCSVDKANVLETSALWRE